MRLTHRYVLLGITGAVPTKLENWPIDPYISTDYVLNTALLLNMSCLTHLENVNKFLKFLVTTVVTNEVPQTRLCELIVEGKLCKLPLGGDVEAVREVNVYDKVYERGNKRMYSLKFSERVVLL